MRLSGVTITGRAAAQKYDVPPTDPFYSNVSLLLHGDGVDGATTFPDNSPSPKTPTRFGNVFVDTAQKQFGTGSIEFPAPTSQGRLQYADNADFNFGTGDFTIEFWVRFNVVNAEQVVITKGWQDTPGFAAFLIYLTSGGQLRFGASSNGGSWDIANERLITSPSATTWTYIAITRSGTTFRAFVNGTIVGGFTFTSALGLLNSATQELQIGGRILNDVTMRGHIDEIRLTKGVARYTASFTPPTEAFPNS